MTLKKPDPSFKLVKANFLAAFDYQTSGTVNMQMESLATTVFDVPGNMANNVTPSRLTSWGSLKLKQHSVLKHGVQEGLRSDFNDDFFDKLAHMNADSFLSQYYTARNESTIYDHTSMIYYSAADDHSSNHVTLNMIVKVPLYQTIVYVPQMA